MSEFDSHLFEEEAASKQELQINPADIRYAAMNYLARREHTHRELRQKLKKRFPDEQLLESELRRLADENLQSDARFAESYARQRSGRGYGPLRVRQEMRDKGLSDSEVDCALDAISADWSAVAEEVYHKKFGEHPAGDLKEKSKRMRFMQYRGFDSSHFRRLIGG